MGLLRDTFHILAKGFVPWKKLILASGRSTLFYSTLLSAGGRAGPYPANGCLNRLLKADHPVREHPIAQLLTLTYQIYIHSYIRSVIHEA